jgi:hypothetical protein
MRIRPITESVRLLEEHAKTIGTNALPSNQNHRFIGSYHITRESREITASFEGELTRIRTFEAGGFMRDGFASKEAIDEFASYARKERIPLSISGQRMTIAYSGTESNLKRHIEAIRRLKGKPREEIYR